MGHPGRAKKASASTPAPMPIPAVSSRNKNLAPTTCFLVQGSARTYLSHRAVSSYANAASPAIPPINVPSIVAKPGSGMAAPATKAAAHAARARHTGR
ncbi:MAG: hypothetical protein DELT_03245 [Desulfovibrio sp.]